ncbi:PREDICTED: diaminopimelate decarboxylase-like [Rhagoletis zephyria]|uniref:diaminopimelate decarboxylase-like n=1 Tax=Rhagoletis zephyria TaxID=28612 RepID=UPI000811893E|nr:PREDICTED: diaminopimelate decarboxylase-like [Rhagoletis zephyria]
MSDSTDNKEGSGFMGSIRRLSRRLSGTVLSADSRDVKAYLVRNDKRNIYSYDGEDQLKVGGIVLKELAEEYGTPLYVYDANRLVDNYRLYLGSLKNVKNFMLCYAVKANPNLALLNLFYKLGAGFDVVSGGEIARCLAAGVDPAKIIFSGCGKTVEELTVAVKADVQCINVESWEELDRIEAVASRHNKMQNISIRVNPELNLDGLSHPNILTGSGGHKFGVPIGEAVAIYSRAKASASLKIKGISCHLGSNIDKLEPFIEARDRLLALADELRQELSICVEHINLGGGFAAQISGASAHVSETPAADTIPQWVERLAKPITERGLKMVLEPGRSLVADGGVLLTKVEYVKAPPYGQQHPIVPGQLKGGHEASAGLTTEFKYNVAGPICETTDVFHRDLVLGQKLESGDYVIIVDAGAYGSSMTSNYNTRNKPAEVMIHDGHPTLIRERETYEEQFKREKLVLDLKLKSLNTVEEAESQEDLNNAA